MMVFVRQRSKFLEARRFGALLSLWWASKITYARRSSRTVYGTWRLRQEWRGSLKEHAAEVLAMSLLRDESEAVCVFNLSTYVRDVEAGQYWKAWAGYGMLLWPQHTLPFSEWSKCDGLPRNSEGVTGRK